jgi:uncharacterized protein (DUF3084 family)
MQDVLENGRRTHASGFGYVALETFADGILLNGQVVKTLEEVQAEIRESDGETRRLEEERRKARQNHRAKLRRRRQREAEQQQDLEQEMKEVRRLWAPVEEEHLRIFQRQGAVHWVQQTIYALQAFLRGEQLQMAGRATNGDWRDFDLAAEIDKGMIAWRAKPKGETDK